MSPFWTSLFEWIRWIFGAFLAVLFGIWSFERSDDRAALVQRWIMSAVFLFVMWVIPVRRFPLLIILPLLGLVYLWVPSLLRAMLKPLTGAFDGEGEEVKPKPFYFLAEGQRRKGLYHEAIAEVRKQLERFPCDFEGTIKLATIQVEDLKDIAAAETTVNDFVASSEQPQYIVSALHTMADWQLQFGRNASAARASLERIEQLYPQTPFAHAAAQRIARLESADETRHLREHRRFEVTPRNEAVGLRKESTPVPVAADPTLLADEYLAQLELHPSDTATREKLAVLYAEEFQRLDLAAEQLEQLISLPSEPPKHVAHWLNLLATLHIKVGNDLVAAEAALRRIGSRIPGGAQASMAERRIATLSSELKGNQSATLKLIPRYEKNLGLNPPK